MANVDGVGVIGIGSVLSSDGTKDHAGVGVVPSMVILSGNIIAAPRVLLASVVTAFKVRVTFDQEMIEDSRLVDIANYAIVPVSAGALIAVENVTPETAVFPSFVDLDITEMTDGESYQVAVNAGAGSPASRFSIPLNVASAFAVFVGLGENPTVVSVEAISENRADVKFSESMFDNVDIRDPSNYVFDQGLSVTSVLDVDGDTVKLITTDQVPGILYNLVIG